MTLLMLLRPHVYGEAPPVTDVKGYSTASDAATHGSAASTLLARASTASDAAASGSTASNA